MAAAPLDGAPAGGASAAAGFLFERAVLAYGLLVTALWADDGALGLGSAAPFLGCGYLLLDTARRLGGTPGDRAAALRPEQWTKLLVLLALLAAARSPGFYLLPGTPRWGFTLLIAAILVPALIGVRPALGARRRDALAAGMLLAALAAGIWVVRASPSPRIDVFAVQQLGAAHLLSGRDPYAALYPNLYTASESLTYFGAAPPQLRCYPYPPLSLLVTSAGLWLGGDVRAAFVALHVLTGLLLYLMVRRRSGATAVGLCALHLLHPRGLFVLEQAWTEPLLAAGAAAWTASALRRPAASRRAQLEQGLLLGLLLAAKQYAVLLLPLLLTRRFRPGWPRAARLISAALAVSVPAALLLPFLLWHPGDLLEDLILFQLRQPFRPDALTLTALLHRAVGVRAPGGLALLGAAVGLGLGARLPRQLAGLLFAAALTCFGFFALAKQAFCNYYSFVAVLLLLCAAACAVEAPPRQRA